MFTAAAVVFGTAGVVYLCLALSTSFELFLLVGFGLLATLIHLATAADEWVMARSRKRRRNMLLGTCLLTLGSGCAHAPKPAPAQVERLECGGSACSITTAGPSTVIWVTE